MGTNVAIKEAQAGSIIESVITKGDLARLTPEERTRYYGEVCRSIGLNPLTQPLQFITLNGKLTLYARRDAADQLRKLHGISIEVVERAIDGELFTVHVRARDKDGRTDEDFGVVTLGALKGEARANAILKAVTKAKRRVTLSISGLGFLDETEAEDIEPAAKTLPKKDAKDIYTKLQREIDEATSRKQLGQWRLDNDDRIKVMPEDWQDILRLRYEEKMADLRQQENKAQAVLDHRTETDDGMDIPPELDRRKPKEALPADALAWIGTALNSITDPDQLEPAWNEKIQPLVDKLNPYEQGEAYGLYSLREAELAP